jgi:ABC-type Fe3+-hydroxamate transport system substrate-binding protein
LNKLAVSGAALLLITLLSGCSGAEANAISASPSATATASPTPTVTKTVTVKASPTPSTIATSGSYKADLAALGVVPDNVKSFGDYMKKEICDETGSSLGVSVRSIGGNATGGGIDGVRLSVAYFCPQKSQEVESYLDYFKK